ncbi:hypothetical protein [Mesorhizobium sp. B2-4-7]|uniref:hypothetical protein n=1 Tax=Mesorhizobium sp. B2-4-7 TaxID=2589942 RepID=UPI00112CF741|nr:hypothetical protein [Mesorhizobium sp. B2-4-7]TPL30169.1 hypothetical protein FJ946_02570 [Mesorhizobium sp. B2-4-7]
MPNLVQGRRGSIPFVKIMKSNLDDPLTVPNTDTGKFCFNSEIQNVGYVKDIFAVEIDDATYPSSGGTALSPNHYYDPPGSDKNTCQIRIDSYRGGAGGPVQQWYFFYEYFNARYGFTFFPLVEYRPTINFSTNQFQGPYVDISGNDGSNGQIFSYIGSKSRTVLARDSGQSGPSGRNRPAISAYVSDPVGNPAVKRCLMTVFDLPIHSESIPNNATTPVSGQDVVKIAPGIARVALPGRTVADTNPLHYVLHEDRIPAKIMAAGTVTVAANATVNITTRLPMTALTYMDFICKKTSEPAFWHPPFIGSFTANANSFTYTMSGTTLSITSTCNFSIDIIYVVYADSGEVPTTGGSKILLKSNDGHGDYIQVKRPGSSDVASNLNDIMIDTRLVYLPILAEGFLNWTSDFPTVLSGSDLFKGVRKANVTVTNPDGLLLFPKVGAVYNLPAVATVFDEPSAVWGEHSVFVNNPSWAGQASGYSTWANMLSTTSVDLFAANNNPWTIQPGAAFYNSQLKGIRYYIFGIPQSL